MKQLKTNKLLLVITIAASTAALSNAANACSRIMVDTPHGETIVRSLDWSEKLGAVAKVHPVGEQRKTADVTGYKTEAKWTVAHQSVAFEEHDLFHGASAEAVNDKGLSASLLYMEDSAPFLSQYTDNGAPAVNLSNIVAFLVENFATVAEAKNALESKEFQIAWNSDLPHSGKHGLHIGVHDKSGNIMLVQLNEGGEVRIHHGDEDLRVMANEPLQEKHREYVKQFDFDDPKTAYKLNTSISSLDRNARLLWTTKNQHSWENLNWPQTEGKLQATFDAGALVPQDVIDPNYGGTYTTWVQYIHNLETGTVKVRNMESYRDIWFNMSDVSNFKVPMCADLIQQSNSGNTSVTWQECSL